MKKILTAMLTAAALSALAENVQVRWDASTTSGVTDYNVYYSTNSGASWVLKTNVSALVAFVNVPTNTTTIGVASVKSGNESNESDEAIIDVLPFVANVRLNGTVLTWNQASLPATGYQIQMSTNLVNWAAAATVTGRTNTTFTLASIPANALAYSVRSTSARSMSLRTVVEVLRPPSNVTIIPIDQ